ncbi:hypothetical protein PM082_021527 [Marasmius tenuissimus]|nr:hypothetical protein PM082_021527 [Marasmius tenuissimus]
MGSSPTFRTSAPVERGHLSLGAYGKLGFSRGSSTPQRPHQNLPDHTQVLPTVPLNSSRHCRTETVWFISTQRPLLIDSVCSRRRRRAGNRSLNQCFRFTTLRPLSSEALFYVTPQRRAPVSISFTHLYIHRSPMYISPIQRDHFHRLFLAADCPSGSRY